MVFTVAEMSLPQAAARMLFRFRESLQAHHNFKQLSGLPATSDKDAVQ
jgi:hypothetical protein